MPIENLNIDLIPFLGAIIVVALLGFCTGPLMRWATDPIRPPDSWKDFLAAGRVIGVMESFLFTLAIIVGYPIFIGAWLAFKVAAKWETWAHVVRLPEVASQDLNSSEFEIRARFGSWLHARFIIGVLLNIIISVIGAWCYLQLQQFVVAA